MRKYTANYSYTNPNFVIQNLVTNKKNNELIPTLYVLKNILQRGFPTMMSKYLQKQLQLEDYHNSSIFKKRFLFIDCETPVWHDTIKGDENKEFPPTKIKFEGKEIKTHNPAKFFYEQI